MRQIIFATLLMLVLLGTNVACNTVHGFGQNVEKEVNKHESDKKPGNALAGYMAHRDGPTASGQHPNSSHRYYIGSACYRCRCFDPGGSVSFWGLERARGLRTRNPFVLFGPGAALLFLFIQPPDVLVRK